MGFGKKDAEVIMEAGREVSGDGFLEVLDNSLCDVEVKVVKFCWSRSWTRLLYKKVLLAC